MEPNATETQAQKPKKKKLPKIQQIALRFLKPGAVIEWQGKPHIVRALELDGNGSAQVTLSWAVNDYENDGISFKSTAYEAHKFTTRAIAQTIKVSRYVQPAKPKASGGKPGSKPSKGKPAKPRRK